MTPAVTLDLSKAQPIAAPAPVKLDMTKAQSITGIEPSETGEVVNDVGNVVTVPKDGEAFGDTLKRAIATQSKMTPEQRQGAIDKETATIPAKTAQTLAGAATIGVVGPAALAGPAALPSVIPHTIEGVKAIGTWATKNPVQAYIMYQILKELVPGAKKTMGIVQHAPGSE